jgi:hypothetical protein
LYLNSNNDRENVIIESMFINFKHTGACVQYITNFYLEGNDLSNQHMYELFNKYLFLACSVYLILTQKIMYFF